MLIVKRRDQDSFISILMSFACCKIAHPRPLIEQIEPRRRRAELARFISVKVAIIGGGAAGMMTAYLLDPAHEVTVFERQPILGGNIRTLGRNVECSALPTGVVLDAGVIEFSPTQFPRLHRLFAALGVETREVAAMAGLITADGVHFQSISKIAASGAPLQGRLVAGLRLLGLAPAFARFHWRARAAVAALEASPGRPVGEYLGPSGSPLGEWLRLLLMYGYSIPRAQIDQLPAALALPTLRAFTLESSWTSIVGGIYGYIDAIVRALRGRVITDALIDGISRTQGGDRGLIEIRRRGAEAERFDAVVIATTPAQVLRLLSDPCEHEEQRFAAWTGNDANAVIHTDSSIYRRRGIHNYSEFDVFARPPGYNAYLNRLCGLPAEHATDYHFSYNLDAEIDSEKILHRQNHRTPNYTVEAFSTRREIIETNGDRHTYYAGAWLGNGLHEGALCSALAVSKRLGGRLL